MAATQQHAKKTHTLRLRRTLAAPPARVFRAWTDPEELKRWSAPGPGEVVLAEVDLRVGGRYRIHMRGPDGQEHRVVGSYREVDAPRRLVYTWMWESDQHQTEMLVTVEFHARDQATEVVVQHERLPDEKSRSDHEMGWNGCLEKLATVF